MGVLTDRSGITGAFTMQPGRTAFFDVAVDAVARIVAPNPTDDPDCPHVGPGTPVPFHVVTQPFTLLDVRPRHQDESVEVLAARVIFHGRGTTAEGYQMFNGYPLVACRRSWPVPGFGPSYPARGLRLSPGDRAQAVLYVRSDHAGLRSVGRGYEVEYRDHAPARAGCAAR